MDALPLITSKTQDLFADVPEHHGWSHISKVVGHCEKALLEEPSLSEENRAVVLAAALLHDADDRKLFPSSNADLVNALSILKSSSFPEHLVPLVISCIRLVSCSSQALYEVNRVQPSWMFIPRDADRLEAIGLEGAVRCLEYGKGTIPLFSANTPRPQSKEDILFHATFERFEAYKKGRRSVSVIDHFYDKLLHLKCDDSGNPYLTRMGIERSQQMVDVLHIINLCQRGA